MRVPSQKFSLALGTSVFFGICLLLVVVSIVFAPNFFRPKTTIETYFKDSINGLSVGAPVRFRGVTIGEVTSIGLSSRIYPRVHINLFSKSDSLAVVRMRVYLSEKELEKEAPNLIKNGLRIQTQLAGLTGTIYLEMDFLNPEQYPDNPIPVNWIPHYLYIPSAMSLTNEIIDNIENFLSALHSMDFDNGAEGKDSDFIGKISGIIVSLNETTSGMDSNKIKQLLASVEGGINSADKVLKDTNIKAINQLVSQLTQTAEGLSKITGDQKVVELSKQINNLTVTFDKAARGNRYNVRALLIAISQLTAQIAQLTQNLSSDPSTFLPAVGQGLHQFR